MLSFIRGRPIAQEVFPAVRRAPVPAAAAAAAAAVVPEPEEEEEGRVLCLYTEGDTKGEDPTSDPVELLGEDFFRDLRKPNGKRLNLEELAVLIEAVGTGEMPDDSDLEQPFHEALEMYLDKGVKEVALSDGLLLPVPNFDVKRETPYIAAPSGAGKSTYAARLCDAYRLVDPEKKIHIFSRLMSDKALDYLKPERHTIGPELKDAKLEAADFENSVVIFDDIDTIPDAKLAMKVQKLRDDLLETGRHENVTVISTSHQIMNYKKTRTLLNEASSVTVFPASGSAYHIQRYLKEYAGCSPAMIKKLMALPTRWLTHVRTAPQYFLHEKGAIMADATP